MTARARLVVATLACLGGGCRDYARFDRTDDLAVVVADLGPAADLAGTHLDALSSHDAAAIDAGGCPSVPDPPDTTLPFPPIATELETALLDGALPPKRIVAGHFTDPQQLDVVVLAPGAANAAELALYRVPAAGGALTLLAGGKLGYCATDMAAGHVQSGDTLDWIVLGCDCGVFPAELCMLRTVDWSGSPTPMLPAIRDTMGVSARLEAFTLGRLDGDDLDDLAYAHLTDSVVEVTRVLAPADGRFSQQGDEGLFVSAPQASALVIGDFNAQVDAYPDIAVLDASSMTPTLQVVLGTATGMLVLAPQGPTLPMGLVTGMAAGDLTGDKRTDLVLTTVASDSAILLSQSSAMGSFDVGTLPTGGDSFSPALVDWNHDGALDLFFWRQGTGNGNNLATVYPVLLRNLGNGYMPVQGPSTSQRTSVVVNPGYMLAPDVVARDVGCTPELFFVDGSQQGASVFTR